MDDADVAVAFAFARAREAEVRPAERVHHGNAWWIRRNGRWEPEEPGWFYSETTGRWYRPAPVQAPGPPPIMRLPMRNSGGSC